MVVEDLIVVVGLNPGLLAQMIALNKLERLVVEVVASVHVLVHHHAPVRQIVIVMANMVVVMPRVMGKVQMVVLVQNPHPVYVIVKVIVVVRPTD